MAEYTYGGRLSAAGSRVVVYWFCSLDGGKPVVCMKSCICIDGRQLRSLDPRRARTLLKKKKFSVVRLHRCAQKYDYAIEIRNTESTCDCNLHNQRYAQGNGHIQKCFGIPIDYNDDNETYSVGCGPFVFTLHSDEFADLDITPQCVRTFSTCISFQMSSCIDTYSRTFYISNCEVETSLMPDSFSRGFETIPKVYNHSVELMSNNDFLPPTSTRNIVSLPSKTCEAVFPWSDLPVSTIKAAPLTISQPRSGPILTPLEAAPPTISQPRSGPILTPLEAAPPTISQPRSGPILTRAEANSGLQPNCASCTRRRVYNLRPLAGRECTCAPQTPADYVYIQMTLSDLTIDDLKPTIPSGGRIMSIVTCG
nr:uncharacterized protein LOC123765815 isoform X2 [Procambarus clarkii]XP_045610545.1 uncharacterized protein LOC123765815 isoform X3 [Procambarus clarkii]